MNLYVWSKETGEYVGQIPSKEDPKGKKVLIPFYATSVVPPSVKTKEVAVFLDDDGNVPKRFRDGSWVVKSDLRGAKYYDADGREFTIKDIGATPPLGSFPEIPQSVLLAKAKRAKMEYIESEYQAKIHGSMSIGGYDFPLDPDRAIVRDGYYRAMQYAAALDPHIKTVKFITSDLKEVDLPIGDDNNIDANDINSQLGLAISVFVFRKSELIRALNEANTVSDVEKITW
jgi:hypothetical protein